MNIRATRAIVLLALGISLTWTYAGVSRDLVHDWQLNGDYSHGFLVVPVALYLCWQRRADLRAAPEAPNTVGLVVLLGSLVLLALGTMGSQFLARVSLVGTLSGLVLYLWGPRQLRICAFPIAFLLFMIPPPAILFDRATVSLQMISSSLAEHALAAVRIPVLREGNVIMLPEVTLDVTDACSGIRSLVSLTALGVLYAYLTDRRLWVRALLVSATLPIAVIANALRVSGTAMAAEFYGLDAAMGFFHTFSGLLLFVAAFSGLWVLHGSVSLVGRWRSAVPRTAV